MLTRFRELPIILRLALPIGAALLVLGACVLVLGVWHFATAPNFEEYVRTHPVDLAILDDDWSAVEQLAQGPDGWWHGTVDPAAIGAEDETYETVSQVVEVELCRDDGVLVHALLDVSLALVRESSDRVGIRAATALDATSGMRAFVVLSFVDPDAMLGEGAAGRGRALVDFFFVSGNGPDEFRVQSVQKLPAVPDPGIGFPLATLVASLFHNLTSGPPEEGIVHHVRLPLSFNSRAVENGYVTGSMLPMTHRANTSEYSYELAVSHLILRNGIQHMERSQTSRLEWRLGGKIW